MNDESIVDAILAEAAPDLSDPDAEAPPIGEQPATADGPPGLPDAADSTPPQPPNSANTSGPPRKSADEPDPVRESAPVRDSDPVRESDPVRDSAPVRQPGRVRKSRPVRRVQLLDPARAPQQPSTAVRRRRPVARKKIEIPDEISASLRDTYNSLCLKVGNTSRSLKRLDAKRQRVRRPFTPSQSERYERDLRALETSLQAMETVMKRINAAWRDLGEKRVIFESAHFRNLRNKHDPCPPK